MVDGDAERCADGILTAVALADRIFLVVLNIEVVLPLPTDLQIPLMSFLASWHCFLQKYKICDAIFPNPIGNPISPRRIEWGVWRGEVGDYSFFINCHSLVSQEYS